MKAQNYSQMIMATQASSLISTRQIYPRVAVRCQKKRTGLHYPRRCSDQVDANADPNWSGFYYYNVPGSPCALNSSVEWRSESSGGCLYQYSGDHLNTYNIHLDIPSEPVLIICGFITTTQIPGIVLPG